MRNLKTLILVVLSVCLAVVLVFRLKGRDAETPAAPLASSSPVQNTSAPGETPAATPEPEPEYFTISAIGDCTLTSHQNIGPKEAKSYAAKMNGDYAYPFSNTVSYFENDDLTLANLECTLSDQKLSSLEQFYFLCPAAYANILTEGCVDFVTTANNHNLDFGQRGLDDTWASLEAVGMPYGKDGESRLLTTESGLTVGIYCAYNRYKPVLSDCTAAIRSLREQGAEYVILMFHWGKEMNYQPAEEQVELAHACIDAGADLVYGSHSHCLQPVEEYNGGYILYSMGNWSFGGSTNPRDPDTAIIQIRVCRRGESVTNEQLSAIPCSVSSRPALEGYTGDNYNDYRPTPYEEGSEAYERVMSKLDGSFEGGNQVVDYSGWYHSWG